MVTVTGSVGRARAAVACSGRPGRAWGVESGRWGCLVVKAAVSTATGRFARPSARGVAGSGEVGQAQARGRWSLQMVARKAAGGCEGRWPAARAASSCFKPA